MRFGWHTVTTKSGTWPPARLQTIRVDAEAFCMSDQRLMTADEVADLLSVTRRVVMDLARSYAAGDPKGLPAIKVKRDWRFTRDDLAFYIAANRNTPQSRATRESAVVDGVEVALPVRARRRGRAA